MSAKKVDAFAAPNSSANEVTVRAGIEGSGVSLKARSRAVSAFDRLIGAAFDIPGIWFERRAERARIIAITEQEALKIDAKTFLADKKARAADPSRPLPVWLEDLSKRIDNRAEVVSYAIEYLKDSAPHGNNPEDENIDLSSMEDWMNAFVHRAEMASSEAMRSILGRILSGEILSPGSFSVATLRIITELDQKSADIFQSLCLSRLLDRHIVKKDKEVQGTRMYDLYDLEERGLIKEVGGSISHTLQKQEDGYYYLREGEHALRFVIEPVGEYIPVSNVLNTMLLTNTGYQLAQLLPYSQEAALGSVAEAFTTREAVKEVDLFRIVTNNLMHVRNIKSREPVA